MAKPTIDVWCRWCGAHPGEPCRDVRPHRGNRVIKKLHAQRVKES
jgi:hypothetical protein